MKKYLVITGLFVSLAACKRDDEVYSLGNKKAANISGVIKFGTIGKSSLEADTAQISLINIKINIEADSENRAVTFTTSLGYFANGKNSITVTANAYGDAQVGIKSANVGDAMISAAIKSASIDTIVHFTPALPDDILLTADKYNLDTSQATNLTATLYRNTGRGLPTDPAKIWFTVTPNTLVYPAFVNSTTHAGAIAIENPFKATGTFKVEAKTIGAAGDTIRRSINIVIN